MIKKLRFIFSAISLFSIAFIATASINAAPVRFNQVKQVVKVKPGKARAGNFTQLRWSDGDNLVKVGDGDDDNTATQEITQQDDRVIRTTEVEVIQEEDCKCLQDEGSPFPYWAPLAIAGAAIPAIIFLTNGDDDPTPTPNPTGTPGVTPTPTPGETPTPTPTPGETPTPTPTPGETPTPTPGETPTPTPGETPTPTPMMTPTPTPPTEPVPEPMTLLLFGTGLAGVGLAARRKFGRKGEEEEEN